MTINNAKTIKAGREFSQMDPTAVDEADLLNIAGGLMSTTALTERPTYTNSGCPPPEPPK
jgi:hypothetical protein